MGNGLFENRSSKLGAATCEDAKSYAVGFDRGCEGCFKPFAAFAERLFFGENATVLSFMALRKFADRELLHPVVNCSC